MQAYAQPVPALNLGRSATWMFASRNWLGNLFWVLICTLLGAIVIGHMVLLGYQLEIVERRARGREDQLPDFEPSRFSDYLMRGLWPFLINFIASMVIGAGVGIAMVMVFMVFGIVVGQRGDPSPIAVLVLIVPLVALGLLAVAAAVFIALPLGFRAGLTGRLEEGFKVNWAIETSKRMWPTMLLAFVYMVLCGLLAEIVGFALCFVGLLVTVPWLQLQLADLAAQVYDIYEAQGGEPLIATRDVVQAEVL